MSVIKAPALAGRNTGAGHRVGALRVRAALA